MSLFFRSIKSPEDGKSVDKVEASEGNDDFDLDKFILEETRRRRRRSQDEEKAGQGEADKGEDDKGEADKAEVEGGEDDLTRDFEGISLDNETSSGNNTNQEGVSLILNTLLIKF